jgi:excinuclease UvrABC ATPase subunit
MTCKKCNGQGYIYVDIDWNRPTMNMGQYRQCSKCKGFGTTGAERLRQLIEAMVITFNGGNVKLKEIEEYAREAMKEYDSILNKPKHIPS